MINKTKNSCVLGVLTAIFLFFSINNTLFGGENRYAIDKWQVQKEEAVKLYVSGNGYQEIDLESDDHYVNQIRDYIISINSELKSKMSVIRSKESPTRDLLFVSSKLCSVMESYPTISNVNYKDLFLKVKDIYGVPKAEKKGDSTTYTFQNSSTSVLLIARPVGESYEVRLYYYPKALFRMLITE